MRHAALLVARIAFLVLCAFFAWRVFEGRGAELGQALGRMSYWVAASALLTIAGLLVTSWLWTRILAGYGHVLPWSGASSVFFTGQVGKYLPGSVWSIGVQARLSASMGVPAPRVIGTGLIFLAIHVASALCLGGAILAVSDSSPVPRMAALGLAALGALAFHPRILGRLSTLLSGGRGQIDVTSAGSGIYALCMAVVWCAYSAALVVLMSDPSWREVWLLVAAVTLSYAAGVVIVVAPAGLGAREAVFVGLMAPSLGVTQATALALVARMVHTAADFLLAMVGARVLHARSRDDAPDT